MGNSIAKFKKYVPLLDEAYSRAALTSVLNSDSSLVREGANANELIVPTISMDGLGKYDRNTGYTGGEVTLRQETMAFNYERGRMFSVDSMDNEETAGLAFGRLAGEFIRTKAAPEMDAVRFATYASDTGISKATAAALSTGEAVLSAITAAQNVLDEDEVPYENRYLFITPTLYNMAASVDNAAARAVLGDLTRVIKVPQSRFYTSVTLSDGTSSSDSAGGYKKAAGAADINFMIIHKAAVMQFVKHSAPKVITPDMNQCADAWKYGYRVCGINKVFPNKAAGIYLHAKAAANS